MGIDCQQEHGSLWSDGSVLELDCGGGCSTCICTKSHRIGLLTGQIL